MRVLARLDYDSREELRAGVQRMRVLLDILPGAKDHIYRLCRFRTRRGWHVEIYSDAKLKAAEMVALQAILGSDYRREAFNLFRATKLSLVPRFWRALPNWNVLHTEKLPHG